MNKNNDNDEKQIDLYWQLLHVHTRVKNEDSQGG